ncbi:MAG: efflux RND transporter periplasmic adaptor subunit [Verrucomicrobiota bacterium]
MWKAFLIVFGIIAVILAVIVGVKGPQFAPPPPFQLPPESVTSAVAEEMVWENAISAVGTLSAFQGATISAEVPGTISTFHFESGQEVEKGDLLFELDTSTERAQLESAQATADLAEVNLKRARELRASRSIAESELDSAEARAKEVKAAMSQIRANLEKKVIRAPFSGRLGIRQVDVGEYLNPGSPVVSLQAVDPIYVDFSLPQQQLSKVANGYELRVSIDTYSDREFVGEVEAIDPDLNLANRMFRVRGALSNADGALKPGMFAGVDVVQPESSTVVAVPGTAVKYEAYGDTIFVIKDGEGSKIVEQRFVTLGRTFGDFIAVTEGISIGEEVVTAGAFKLFNGRSVVTNNESALAVSLDPKPEDS